MIKESNQMKIGWNTIHKGPGIICVVSLLIAGQCFAQTEIFDIFTYQPPSYFYKSELPAGVQFSSSNNDTAFCSIILYKSIPAKADWMKQVLQHWNERVVKQLAKADKKPVKIMTGQRVDGWESTLCIGNFYRNKKKAVVMLNAYRNGTISTCVVYAFSDKIYKEPVEKFSNNLHLPNQPTNEP